MTEQEERAAIFAVQEIANRHASKALTNGWEGAADHLNELARHAHALENQFHKGRQDYLVPKTEFKETRVPRRQR